MPQHCFFAQQLNQLCRKTLEYGTFCRKMLECGTFCRETLKYGTFVAKRENKLFFRKTLKYALRGKILNEVRL